MFKQLNPQTPLHAWEAADPLLSARDMPLDPKVHLERYQQLKKARQERAALAVPRRGAHAGANLQRTAQPAAEKNVDSAGGDAGYNSQDQTQDVLAPAFAADKRNGLATAHQNRPFRDSLLAVSFPSIKRSVSSDYGANTVGLQRGRSRYLARMQNKVPGSKYAPYEMSAKKKAKEYACVFGETKATNPKVGQAEPAAFSMSTDRYKASYLAKSADARQTLDMFRPQGAANSFNLFNSATFQLQADLKKTLQQPRQSHQSTFPSTKHSYGEASTIPTEIFPQSTAKITFGIKKKTNEYLKSTLPTAPESVQNVYSP